MSPRGRRLTAAITGLVLLLFSGKWTAELLADRWWAAEVSPAAVRFLTHWHLLQLLLEVAGLLVAGLWFVGHLLLVVRAVGSVQVRRNVANLEIREALTPGTLVAIAVGTGVILGILVGGRVGGAGPAVALAWQGVTYGASDPLIHRDAGFYIAQVPLWQAVHGFAFLLVTLALGLVFALYLVVGAVRWLDGRPAINNHARAHLGWLLASLALVLVWGYLLDPFELIAGLDGTANRAAWRSTALVAQVLAGVALATAILSALWAVYARHALAAAGWIVLPLASLVGNWMVPPAVGGTREPVAEAGATARLAEVAYGLEQLAQSPFPLRQAFRPPVMPSLWSPAMVSRALAADSVDILSIDAALLTVGGVRRPAWFATRVHRGGRLTVVALADDRAGPFGEPLFYRARDTLPTTSIQAVLDVGTTGFHAEAPRNRVSVGGEGPGVALTSWPRRLVLAWALQAGSLLGPEDPAARVDWSIGPEDRVRRLLPVADWGAPVARIVDGELVWMLDGYLPARGFPLSTRLEWRGRDVGAVRAAFVATVMAETGATHIYQRPGSDGLAAAWAAIAQGVVEPASAMPEAIWHAAPYPAELLGVQARELERSAARPGALTGRLPGASSHQVRPDVTWAEDSAGPVLVVSFERAGERRLNALLQAAHEDGNDVLRLTRIDSAAVLPSRGAIETRWARFPSYDALNDSIREDGSQLERGPVRFDLGPAGLVAYQSHFATGPGRRVAMVWVSVATGTRQGAGHTLQDAWNNLLGASAPPFAVAVQTNRLDEARQQLILADSALRAADWEAFGRAWNALRHALGVPADSSTP